MKPLNIKTLGLILMAVALATVVMNELRPLQSNSIYLLLAAGLAAILPYLKSFKAGGVEVNLKELIEGKMDEVKQEVQTQATELEKKVEIQTQAVQKEAQENREKIQTEIQEKIQTAQSSLQEQVSSVAAQAARAARSASIARAAARKAGSSQVAPAAAPPRHHCNASCTESGAASGSQLRTTPCSRDNRLSCSACG